MAGSDTRKKILDASRRLFLKKGYHQTPTLEIANSSGVSEGTVFNHFGSKKNILLSLVDEVNTDQISAIAKEVSSQDSRETLTKFLIKHRSTLQKNSDLLSILLYESRFYPELQKKFIENIASKIISPLEELVSERIRSGEFREIRPQVAARAFIGMIMPFIAWKEILKAEEHGYSDLDNLTVIEEIVEIFLMGVQQC